MRLSVPVSAGAHTTLTCIVGRSNGRRRGARRSADGTYASASGSSYRASYAPRHMGAVASPDRGHPRRSAWVPGRIPASMSNCRSKQGHGLPVSHARPRASAHRVLPSQTSYHRKRPRRQPLRPERTDDVDHGRLPRAREHRARAGRRALRGPAGAEPGRRIRPHRRRSVPAHDT